jgi:phage-related protein
MQKAFQPTAVKVFNEALKVANTLMPAALPFARTFGDALTGLLKQFDKFAQSSGFKNWLAQFHSLEGPALNSIGHGIGQVAIAVGKLFTSFSGRDVAHAINIAFGGISGTINAVTATVRTLMNTWDGAVLAFKTSSHSVASAFDSVRHGFAGLGNDIANGLKGLMNLGPSIFSGLYNAAKSAAKQVVQGFAGIPSAIKAIFNGANSLLNSAGSAIIHGLISGAKSAWSAVSSWFASVGGMVKGFFGGAGGWLVQAGSAIMNGLLSGIESAWNKVASFLSSLAGKIKSLKGPLDYDRVMLYPHGQAIMQGLMGGMQSQVPALESQLKGITNKISNAAGHAAGGGGDIHVHVSLDGRQIYSAVAERSVQTQRRTGHNGMQKRTR